MIIFYLIYLILVFIPCLRLSQKLFPNSYSKYPIPKITQRYLDAVETTRQFYKHYKLQQKGGGKRE